jgi:hypothetical protein
MTERITTDFQTRIWNADNGTSVKVRPDSDGLGLCEIAYHDGGDAKEVSFLITWGMAAALSDALKVVTPLNEPAQ